MTPELLQYVNDHSDPEPDDLYRLMRASNIHLINGRMCSGHLQGRLLKMLVAMIKPKRILELGTFSGYSALCMAEGSAPDTVVDTVEVDDELEDFITDTLSKSPYGAKVRLHIADALEFTKSCEPASYDLIFIDADKRLYSEYYEATLRALRPGGFIIADNTLWDGHVVEEDHFHDPQTAAIRRFNDLVAADPRVEKVMLPVRDGLTLIRLTDKPKPLSAR